MTPAEYMEKIVSMAVNSVDGDAEDITSQISLIGAKVIAVCRGETVNNGIFLAALIELIKWNIRSTLPEENHKVAFQMVINILTSELQDSP